VSHPRLAVFARHAKGQVAPLRILEGQRTGLSRSSHGVFLDVEHNEIVAPSALAGAIVVYGREQHGNTPPIRTIQGSLTHLNSPQGVAGDNVNDEIVVSNDGRLSILVFDRGANGNVAFKREIVGSNTGITKPQGIVVDPVHDEIILADEGDTSDPTKPAALLVFPRMGEGNLTPVRKISTGPLTVPDDPFHLAFPGILRPRQLQLDTERDELVVSDRGLTQEFNFETPGYIGIWNRTDDGATPPKRIIRGPRSELTSPRSVYVDPDNDEIGAGDTNSHSIMVYPRDFRDHDESDDRDSGDRDSDEGNSRDRDSPRS